MLAETVVTESCEDDAQAWISDSLNELFSALGDHTCWQPLAERLLGTVEQKLSPLEVITAKPGSVSLVSFITRVHRTLAARAFTVKACT